MDVNLEQLIDHTMKGLLASGEISFSDKPSDWLPVVQERVASSVPDRAKHEQEKLLSAAVHAAVELQSAAWSPEDYPDNPWWWEHHIDFNNEIMESIYDVDPRLRIGNELHHLEIKRDKCRHELSSIADRQYELLEDLSSIHAERGELSDELLRLEIEFVPGVKPTNRSDVPTEPPAPADPDQGQEPREPGD